MKKQKQIENIREKLCQKPADVNIKDYEYNFSGSKNDVTKDCKKKANSQVTLRNTRSYFTEVLEIIGTDFALAIKDELLAAE